MYDLPIFISHSWSYPEHYNTLSGWIFGGSWNAGGTPINFRDVSVPKENPIHYAPNEATLKAAIFQRIQLAHVVVIPTGMYATHSKWIGKEIEGSQVYGKPILAVNPWGQEKKSSKVVEASHEHVGWNKESVINAIWRLRSRG
jgi:hypothetical protein